MRSHRVSVPSGNGLEEALSKCLNYTNFPQMQEAFRAKAAPRDACCGPAIPSALWRSLGAALRMRLEQGNLS